ncbi:unnamed protein product [Chondrus crispus]|uniref:Uncharacterized protein n=1 Tax=Chondrus crispus TaxID=2769 RepID=R7QU50_CHOCR|nr:unnamed protein product [Chondrus crispus]CDF40986.1 unnamed protein product [Chondrus crispus]|eukprot:XP_005711280.1 unnamed protein product [Chondrus crispus]
MNRPPRNIFNIEHHRLCRAPLRILTRHQYVQKLAVFAKQRSAHLHILLLNKPHTRHTPRTSHSPNPRPILSMVKHGKHTLALAAILPLRMRSIDYRHIHLSRICNQLTVNLLRHLPLASLNRNPSPPGPHPPVILPHRP